MVEANHNGIPVIASKIGGIPEAAGFGQLLIEDYKNNFVWENALSSVLYDEKLYRSLVEKAYSNSRRFGKQNIMGLLQALQQLFDL